MEFPPIENKYLPKPTKPKMTNEKILFALNYVGDDKIIYIDNKPANECHYYCCSKSVGLRTDFYWKPKVKAKQLKEYVYPNIEISTNDYRGHSFVFTDWEIMTNENINFKIKWMYA